jgi:hypothetical protein
MKHSRLELYIACASSLFAASVISAVADQSDDIRYAQRQQRNELLDTEKYLLDQDGALSREAWEMKRTIDELHKRLSFTESKLADVRHKLISVRMQLMP